MATNIGGNNKKKATFLQKPKFLSFFGGKKTRHLLKNIQIFGGGRHGAKIQHLKKKLMGSMAKGSRASVRTSLRTRVRF